MKNTVRRKRWWVFGGLLIGIFFFTAVPVQAQEAAESPSAEPTASIQPTVAPEKKIDKLLVTGAPLELVYGQALEASQITLTVQYSDGTSEIVNPDKTFSIDTKKLGKQKVTFSYGGSSADYTFTIVPRQVTGVVMKKGTKDSMQIAWESLEEAAAYEIYTADRENGKYTFQESTEKNEYTFRKLEQGNILYVKIRAVWNQLSGEDSVAKAIAAKPDRVEKVTVTGSESTAVSIQWETAYGATGYAVYYRLTTKSAYTYAGSTGSLMYRVTGLTAGKEYEFMVCSFAADISNPGENSDTAVYGTAPAVPVISELKGGDRRLKVYWKNAKGAEEYRIYCSTKMDSGFTLAGVAKAGAVRIYPIDNLEQKKVYYIKIEALRVYKQDTLKAVSPVLFAKTGKAASTSTAAKYYNTLAKFKKSPAYKGYKKFRERVVYKRSYILPGMKKTNVGGFNTTKMVPQSITFAGGYLLISAYDKAEEQESVIFIMDKSSRKYITSLILPHKGHVGGMAYDGKNLWISYGKNLQCIKYSVIEEVAKSGKDYAEIYQFTTQAEVPDTASYVAYYKNRIWVGTYNQTVKKYMYGYSVSNKSGVPVLKQTNKMLMPNRTQGAAFFSDGRMLISRSCQTRKGKSGFLCQIDVYKPTWNLTKKSIKKNTKKKSIQMPPMNEGIVVSGSYTYLVFESPAFPDCPAPVDRVAAFKNAKLIK